MEINIDILLMMLISCDYSIQVGGGFAMGIQIPIEVNGIQVYQICFRLCVPNNVIKMHPAPKWAPTFTFHGR